jgi:glycosyltransferase involved in cell wall biosynthesis
MWRYRTGYDRLRDKGFDIIFFIEDDDYYQPFFIEEMLMEWELQKRPNLFGTRYTIYYHIMLQQYFTMRHDDRASAMNTMIKPDMTFPWGNDADPFTDMWLWYRPEFDRKLFLPKRILAVGMKHGLTMTGGKNHADRLKAYINDDNHFLRNTLTEDSYNFYFALGEKMRSGELKQYGK